MLTQEAPNTAVATSAVIKVETPDGRTDRYDITPDNNLIVGSSKNCTIQLVDGDVAGMHCLIRLNGGRLSVQDWYTTSGTYLNGQKLSQPESFGPGDEIRVSDFRLRAEFGELGAPASAPAKPQQNSPAKPAASARSLDESTDASRAETKSEREAESNPESADMSIMDRYRSMYAEQEERQTRESHGNMDDWDAPAAAHDEIPDVDPPVRNDELESLRQRVTELELENEELLQRRQFWGDDREETGDDPFEAEMVELLKAEVTELQDEVAQRDAKILELNELVESGGLADDRRDDSAEMAALVDRLERMLDELQASDERAVGLENLLREADEATRAEQEERMQLAAWVNDIEERIAQREAEWRANEDALKKRIDQLNDERGQFDERLKDLMRRQGATAQAQLIAELRSEVDDLKNRLETAERTREELRTKIETTEFQSTEEGIRKRIDDALRQERAELSQEHAKLARARAELARDQANVTRAAPGENARTADDASTRVNSLRQELAANRGGKPKPEESRSLTSRIASLWKRLDDN